MKKLLIKWGSIAFVGFLVITAPIAAAHDAQDILGDLKYVAVQLAKFVHALM